MPKACREKNGPCSFLLKETESELEEIRHWEKELMAIVYKMEHYKFYLCGKEFLVRIDHRPLQWLKDLKNPSTRLARWLKIGRQFVFRIEFNSETQNVAADALSSYFLFGGEEEEDVKEPGIILIDITHSGKDE